MKSVFLIFFLLYIVSAYSSENVESTLAIKEQGAYSGIYTLQIRENEVYVNGIKLSKGIAEKNVKEIASILENSGKEEACSGNEFIHQVKDNKGLRRERGCTSAERSKELQETFQKLQRSI